MINGRRSKLTQTPPSSNVLTINQPDNICGAPINSTVNIPVDVTSDPVPLPANTDVNWGGSVDVVEGDQPLALSAAGQFRMRVCVLGRSSVSTSGSYISVTTVFAVSGSNPRPTVQFFNTIGWVKLKVYVTDGYTVVSTSTIVVGTSPTQCQAALGVVSN